MKFKIGHVYSLTFMDHAISTKKPAKFRAWGYVLADEDDYVYLTSWLLESDDKEFVDNNLEDFVVLKSCILKKRLLE